MKLAPEAFKYDGQGTIISLHLQPGAKRSAVCGMYGDALKLSVKSPPVDGRANAALREFLAAELGIPLAAVKLLSGMTGRDKRIHISGMSPEAVMAALEK